MESNTQQTESQRAAVRKHASIHYGILSAFKTVHGTGLLACGGVAVYYTSGQQYNTHSPPYYLGAFIVGVLLTGCGLTCIAITRRVRVFHNANRSERNTLITYMLCNAIFSGITAVAALIGAFICAMYGIYLCYLAEFPYTMCSYSSNNGKNALMAVIIDTGLLAAIPLCLHGICVLKRFGKPLTKNREPAVSASQRLPLVNITAQTNVTDARNNPDTRTSAQYATSNIHLPAREINNPEIVIQHPGHDANQSHHLDDSHRHSSRERISGYAEAAHNLRHSTGSLGGATAGGTPSHGTGYGSETGECSDRKVDKQILDNEEPPPSYDSLMKNVNSSQ